MVLKIVDIILLESVETVSKDELHTREAHYIKTIKCINKNIPLRSKKEWDKDNSEKVKSYDKHYKETHKEQYQNYKKVKTICKCGTQYRKCDKLQHERSQKHQKYCLTI